MSLPLPSRLLRQYGPPTRRGDTWAEWPCPRCPKGQSKSVLKWRQGYSGAKCYGCGLWVPSEKRGSERPQEFSDKVFNQGWSDSPKERSSRQELPEPAQEEMARWMVCSLGSEQGKYLRLRGLTDAEILRYFVYDPHYPDYVIFPLREEGRTVSWQGRRVVERGHADVAYSGGAKSISARTALGWEPSTNCVWGLDRIQPQSPVHITEGVMDAFHFPTGVAILGSYLQESQARKILDRLDPLSTRIICVCPDSDNEVWKEWCDLLYRLDRSIYIERKLLPSGVGDFGELVEKGKRLKEKEDE